MPGQAAAQDELSCARGGTFMRNLRRAQFGGIAGRGYRWTEMWLLVLPSAFMLVGLLTLLLVPTVNDLATPVAHHTLPPLDAFTPAFGLIAALVGAHLLLTIIAPDADQTILPLAGTLSSIGVIMSLRLGPDLNQPALGTKQLVWVIIGLVFCIATVKATQDLRWIRNFKYTWAAVGIALVGVTLVRAHSFSTSAPSRDVLSIGPGGLSFQPSEILKICLVVFFAGYLSENREMLASASYRLGPLRLPPVKHLGPLIAMLGIALLIFVGVRELGLAILIFGLFLSMLYVASNRPMYVVVSILIFALGAFVLYQIFPYARARVAIVGNAFDPNVALDQGYQIVQGLIAFGTGGVFGSGLGLGKPYVVPASNTDYIAASFGEEFGFAGVLAVFGLFMLLVYRGMHIAVNARDSFNQLMAVGLTAVFALQTLVILAGNLKIMPLTGVPLPFIAYGGSSVIANFIIIGLMIRLSQRNT
jgi:cell division protein FtsW (lipid II flippase)